MRSVEAASSLVAGLPLAWRRWELCLRYVLIIYILRVLSIALSRFFCLLSLQTRRCVYRMPPMRPAEDRRRMDRLAELRERRALTLRELAEMSSVAADTINQIELGHRKPRPSTLRKLARALGVDVEEFYAEPAVPFLDEAPKLGRPSAIDVAKDAARRQIALEKQAMFGGRREPMLDQRHANEAMRRHREEYGLDGDDAEALVDFALKDAHLEEENATLRDRLQEREQAHS
jgi:transcriptional regulator with XRE-family HTH domain